MAKNVKIEILPGAVEKLLKSREALGVVESAAHRIAARAGGEPDYEVTSMIGRGRARASVVTATPEAMYDEATRRTLTRAIDAGRG